MLFLCKYKTGLNPAVIYFIITVADLYLFFFFKKTNVNIYLDLSKYIFGMNT